MINNVASLPRPAKVSFDRFFSRYYIFFGFISVVFLLPPTPVGPWPSHWRLIDIFISVNRFGGQRCSD